MNLKSAENIEKITDDYEKIKVLAELANKSSWRKLSEIVLDPLVKSWSDSIENLVGKVSLISL